MTMTANLERRTKRNFSKRTAICGHCLKRFEFKVEIGKEETVHCPHCKTDFKVRG